MSHAITDASERDMLAEFAVLEQLNEDIDQAAAVARDCDSLCPEAKTLLDLAWWFTEDAIREATGACSAHYKGYCACCHHYNELKARASRIKGVLR
jgi:hypothetical protein